MNLSNLLGSSPPTQGSRPRHAPNPGTETVRVSGQENPPHAHHRPHHPQRQHQQESFFSSSSSPLHLHPPSHPQHLGISHHPQPSHHSRFNQQGFDHALALVNDMDIDRPHTYGSDYTEEMATDDPQGPALHRHRGHSAPYGGDRYRDGRLLEHRSRYSPTSSPQLQHPHPQHLAPPSYQRQHEHPPDSLRDPALDSMHRRSPYTPPYPPPSQPYHSPRPHQTPQRARSSLHLYPGGSGIGPGPARTKDQDVRGRSMVGSGVSGSRSFHSLPRYVSRIEDGSSAEERKVDEDEHGMHSHSFAHGYAYTQEKSPHQDSPLPQAKTQGKVSSSSPPPTALSTVPWHGSSLRNEIIQQESPPHPHPDKAAFLTSASSRRTSASSTSSSSDVTMQDPPRPRSVSGGAPSWPTDTGSTLTNPVGQQDHSSSLSSPLPRAGDLAVVPKAGPSHHADSRAIAGPSPLHPLTQTRPPAASTLVSTPLSTLKTEDPSISILSSPSFPMDPKDSSASPPPSPPSHAPTLNNKRRSVADLLFIPSKNKEKRNSSASSVSSVESYRQEEGVDHLTWTISGRPTPNIADSHSTLSSPALSHTAGSSPQQPRKTSTANKGRGSGAFTGTATGSGLGAGSSPKTFQCTGYPGCNMVFTRSEHLARHERKHTGEKPYKCIVANCPRVFSRYDNMIQHTQTHGDRSKRDSLSANATLSSPASSHTTGSGFQSRSSSVQSTPLLQGRPRGGSSPLVFGSSNANLNGHDDPPFGFHHPHQQQLYPPQQVEHTQWTLPSGALATSSPALLNRNRSSIYEPDNDRHHPYVGVNSSTSSTPTLRTLKTNSKSLPHLQPRASPAGGPNESPSVGLQSGMSHMEIEELKRRKSEILLPSSARNAGPGFNRISAGPAIGLGMTPFTPTTSHPQSLSQVETLTPQEQDRLNEHRRSAHAMMARMSASSGSIDSRLSSSSTSSNQDTSHPFYHPPTSTGELGRNASMGHLHHRTGIIPRAGRNIGPPLPQVQHLTPQEKDRLLEHRKSTPELMYEPKMAKRSSNDPVEADVQPLPSRDSRSGLQWFSQVNAPPPPSPPASAIARGPFSARSSLDSGGGQSLSGSGYYEPNMATSPTAILPPILGYSDPATPPSRTPSAELPPPRQNSSHLHPLSRPGSISHSYDPSAAATFFTPYGSDSGVPPPPVVRQMDSSMSLRMEHDLQDRYYPIPKRQVMEVLDRMEEGQFRQLKATVSESFANEQFRNPEFLSNMTAVLCVLKGPAAAAAARPQHEKQQQRRQSLKEMQVDGEENIMAKVKEQDGESTVNGVVGCHHVLDIDTNGFERDPEQDLRGLDDLTFSSLYPTRSFVAGFEPVMPLTKQEGKDYTAPHPHPHPYHRQDGYPSNARIGRFYLPEHAYRTRESLSFQPNARDPWGCYEFQEYEGIAVWVPESVMDRYRLMARQKARVNDSGGLKYRMALTLVEPRKGEGDEEDDNMGEHSDEEVDEDEEDAEQHQVRLRESVLYPGMIQEVWRDLHQQHLEQQHPHPSYQHQQQHRQQPPYDPLRANHPNQIATFEEYQKSLHSGSRSSSSSAPPPPPLPPPSSQRTSVHFHPHAHTHHPYRHSNHPYAHPSSSPPYPPRESIHDHDRLHREDLSSAQSSPPSSPLMSSQHPSSSTTSSQFHRRPSEDHPMDPSSSTKGPEPNMLRRISIAELCNPMSSLATERQRQLQQQQQKQQQQQQKQQQQQDLDDER